MFPINEQVIGTLTKIRQKMAVTMEAAWGPEAVDQPPGTSADTASAGEGGADNPTDVNDALDMYLCSIADRLEDEFDLNDDKAFDFIFQCSDELADGGDMPPLPEDGAPDQDVSLWMGKANTIGFTGYVLGRARADS